MFDQAAVRSILLIMYGDAPGLIHVCSPPNPRDWRGRFFDLDHIEDAVEYVTALDAAGKEGIYARVTTVESEPDARTNKRGGAGDSAALPFLWADLDIAGPGHAEANLPPDVAAAMSIVTTAGMPPPSLWIHSGGGLYPIWTLAEPHLIRADPSAVAETGELTAMWQQAIGAVSASLGWRYGTGVGDLSRVLRIAGTVNRKVPGVDRPCRLMLEESSGARYGLDELARVAVDVLDRYRVEPEPPEASTHALTERSFAAAVEGLSTADDFNGRALWPDILMPHGWRIHHRSGEVGYWKRPGKTTAGYSATTNYGGADRLVIHSAEAAPFEVTSYSKFGAYAVLNYSGDHRAAYEALRAAGWGSRPTPAERNYADMAGIVGADRLDISAGADMTRTGQGSAPHPEPHASSDPALAEVDAHTAREARIAAEVYRIEVNTEARRRVAAAEFTQTYREPEILMSLADDLAEPREPTRYRIGKLLSIEGNAVLTAQYKTGKTTVINNLIRSLVDGEPFLGRFDVEPFEGRVMVFNYEVAKGQYMEWLALQGIANAGRVRTANLRGFFWPPTVREYEERIVKLLAESKTQVWIVDPFSRAFTGCGDENSNSDVARFLDTLDQIKQRAGVSELILTAHTGRAEFEPGQERARGATRLDDWADARWLLVADDQGRRYFRAHGRDVDIDEERLNHDADTHRLTMGGWDRRNAKINDLVDECVTYIGANPGLSASEVVEGMGKQRATVLKALTRAAGAGKLVTVDGGRGKRLHYLPGTPGSYARSTHEPA